MKNSSLVRLALSNTHMPLLILVLAVTIVTTFPVKVGFDLATVMGRAVAAKVDDVEVRKIVIEPQSVAQGETINFAAMEVIRGLEGVSYAQPLIEIGVRIQGDNNLTVVEGIGESDPRFSPDRLISGRSLLREDAGEPVVVVGRALSVVPGDQIVVSIFRRNRDVSEEHLVRLRVVGVSSMEGRRIFLPLNLAASIDRWAQGSIDDLEINASNAPQFQIRAVVFARDIQSISSVVASMEALEYRTKSRLRDVASVARVQTLIIAVTTTFASGFVLAGWIATGVFVATARKLHTHSAAALKLSGTQFLQAFVICVGPSVAAGVVGVSVAVATAHWSCGLLWKALSSSLSIPSDVTTATSTHFSALAPILAILPLFVGLAMAFIAAWRTPVLIALRSRGQ